MANLQFEEEGEKTAYDTGKPVIKYLKLAKRIATRVILVFFEGFFEN